MSKLKYEENSIVEIGIAGTKKCKSLYSFQLLCHKHFEKYKLGNFECQSDSTED
jgi:hypothetical protein